MSGRQGRNEAGSGVPGTLAEIGIERRWDHLAAFVRSDSLRTEKYVQVSMRRPCVSSDDELLGSRRAPDMPTVPSALDSCPVIRRRKSSTFEGGPRVGHPSSGPTSANTAGCRLRSRLLTSLVRGAGWRRAGNLWTLTAIPMSADDSIDDSSTEYHITRDWS